MIILRMREKNDVIMTNSIYFCDKSFCSSQKEVFKVKLSDFESIVNLQNTIDFRGKCVGISKTEEMGRIAPIQIVRFYEVLLREGNQRPQT